MDTTQATSAADLVALDDDALVERINEAHLRAAGAACSLVEHAVETGRLLIEAKRRCGHGAWLPWLAEHATFSARTAQAYMRIARGWPGLGRNAQRSAPLSIAGALRGLTAPTRRGRQRERGPHEKLEVIHVSEIDEPLGSVLDLATGKIVTGAEWVHWFPPGRARDEILDRLAEHARDHWRDTRDWEVAEGIALALRDVLGNRAVNDFAARCNRGTVDGPLFRPHSDRARHARRARARR